MGVSSSVMPPMACNTYLINRLAGKHGHLIQLLEAPFATRACFGRNTDHRGMCPVGSRNSRDKVGGTKAILRDTNWWLTRHTSHRQRAPLKDEAPQKRNRYLLQGKRSKASIKAEPTIL
jgi:hypothetical protein